MAISQITYNPGILGDESLARSFVVRQQSLELILEALRENAALPSGNRHLLMIGPRGIGKTMLVRRVAAAVRSNDEYSAKWYPLVFGEESYPVGTPGEFWLEALFHLTDQTGDPRLEKTLEELRDEPSDSRLRGRALGQLLDFADHQKKRVLLIVENLNSLIGEQMDADAAWDLRHTLMNEPRLMLLGTATNRFDEIEDIGHAWFEMFSVHQLQPLNVDECGELWRSVTGTSLRGGQVKAIRILTGGNPRLITILAGFAANHSFRQLLEQLVHLIDDHTEYFKGHLDSLAVKERRVFVALLEKWDPISAAELARQTRLSVNEVSALLGRLGVRGAVEVAQQKGRRKLYQASERLYNIYYLMRRRGHPEGRVQAAVRFMIGFYEREELVMRLADLAREACGLPEDVRQDHYWAYREVLRKMEEITPLIIEYTPPEFFQSVEGRLARDAGVLGLMQQAHSHYHAGKLQQAEKLYRRALELDQNNHLAWSGLAGVLFQDPEKICQAEEAGHKATVLAPGNRICWFNLGLTFSKQERWQEARQAFSKAVELDPSDMRFWNMLGWACQKAQRYQEAEHAFRMAIQLEPNDGGNWNNLANALWEQKRLAEAEAAYRKAIELEPSNVAPWQGLGHLLIETGPPEEAERIWEEALKLHSHQLAPCSVHLLELRLARGVDPDRILDEAQEWIDRYKEDVRIFVVMAELVVRKGLTKGLTLAEAWVREAFAKDQNLNTARALALVFAEMGNWQGVLKASSLLIDSATEDQRARVMSTQVLIRAAAAGWAKEALTVLKGSKGAAALEPLSVGLQIYLGETPTVAKEILEVGQDVADRIRRCEPGIQSDLDKHPTNEQTKPV